MREKLLWSAVIVLGLLLALAHAQTPAASGSQIGRFQIISVQGDNGGSPSVLKLDTATGRTWMKMSEIQAGGANDLVFSEIRDVPLPQPSHQ